jgi:hypothetical protein
MRQTFARAAMLGTLTLAAFWCGRTHAVPAASTANQTPKPPARPVHRPQAQAGGQLPWLDAPKPASWNVPRLAVPEAPKATAPIDAKCRSQARPPEVAQDKHVRDRGWDLVGAYQGGWQVVVIRGTAGYDGMCRPQQYQEFVFLDGVFAGTLSPQPMRSRTDGALIRTTIQSGRRIIAEYARYAPGDPLCCPSNTTTVVFAISQDPPVVRPASTSTSKP